MKFQFFPKIIDSKFESQINNVFFNENAIFRNQNQNTSAIRRIKDNKSGYFYEIVLFGLNYNAKRVKYFRREFFVDLQKSHRIVLEENLETPFRTRIFKRRLVFFGFDNHSLINTVYMINKKKPQNSYFGHGAIVNVDKYKVKPGKVKQK